MTEKQAEDGAKVPQRMWVRIDERGYVVGATDEEEMVFLWEKLGRRFIEVIPRTALTDVAGELFQYEEFVPYVSGQRNAFAWVLAQLEKIEERTP